MSKVWTFLFLPFFFLLEVDMPREVPNAQDGMGDSRWLKRLSIRAQVLVSSSPLPTMMSEVSHGVACPFFTGSLSWPSCCMADCMSLIQNSLQFQFALVSLCMFYIYPRDGSIF